MKCPICGKENSFDALFCTGCGNRLKEAGDSGTGGKSVSPFLNTGSSSSISIIDSIVIGNNNMERETDETKSDMEEAREGLNLLQQMKAIKRGDVAGYKQIENESKMVDAKIELMKMEAEKAGGRREGALASVDLMRTLNELREQCKKEEVFEVKVTVEVLKKKVKDEKSLRYLEQIERLLDTLYDNSFCKVEKAHQERILEVCTYIEEAHFSNLIRGQEDEAF